MSAAVGRATPILKGPTFPPLASAARAVPYLAKGLELKSRRSSLIQYRINPSTHIIRRPGAAK
jgi:hypothetical protein